MLVLSLRVASIGATRVGTSVIAFVSTLLLTNLLGASEFGIYAVFLNLLLLLSSFGKWGWDGGSVRFVAAYLSDRNAGAAKAFSFYALKQVLYYSTATATVVLICAGLLLVAKVERGAPLWLFLGAAMVLPVMVVSLLSQGTLRGQGRQLQAELYEGLIKPVALITIVFVAGFVTVAPTATLAVVAYGTASLLAAAGGWWRARAAWHGVVATALDTMPVREWRRATAAHGLVNFCQTFIGKMPVIVAGLMLPPAQVALLAVAVRVSETLQLGTTAVGLTVAPHLASLAHQGRVDQLKAAMRDARKISLLIALVGGGGLCLFSRPVLALFGPEFSGAAGSLIILTIAQILNAAIGPVGYLATMTGRQAEAARICFAVAALSLPLLAFSGWMGSAFCLAVGYAIAMLLQSGLLWRMTRLRRARSLPVPATAGIGAQTTIEEKS